MLELQTTDLDQIRKMHLVGLDQTANLKSLFNNDKKVALAKMDFSKKSVLSGHYYLTRIEGFYIVVEMFNGGNVYKIDDEKYYVEATSVNILVTDNETGEEHLLLDSWCMPDWGDVKHYGVSNYTWLSSNAEKGFKGYPAVRFNDTYKECLRIHWIVALMNWGIEVVANCVGNKSERTHDIHHDVSFSASGDNSISNLIAMYTESHELLHGYYTGR